MNHYRRLAICTCVMAGSGFGTELAHAQIQPNTKQVEETAQQLAAADKFDLDILKQRGLNPAVAEYFSRARGFEAGSQPVLITINGDVIGRRDALFDDSGKLCFSPDFVARLGLLPMDGSRGPADLMGGNPVVEPTACPDYRDFSPRTLVVLQASIYAIDITVPAEYLQPVAKAYLTEYGGTGALFNYRAYATNSRNSNAGSDAYRYRYLDTTLGFNMDNWLVRSHQDYYNSNGTDQIRWRSIYAQKTFETQKHVLQFGRIITQDPLFGGLPITGAQWFPERALYKKSGNFPIAGVAGTRARVEIRQENILLHNTVVPPGPFSLTDYSVRNYTSDLQIRLIEESGTEQVFTVPASSLLLAAGNMQLEGWNLATGTYWDQTESLGRAYREAMLISASHGWTHDFLSGTVGGLVSKGYASAGGSIKATFIEQQANLFGQVLASNDSERSMNGVLTSLAAGKTVGTDLQVGVSANMRSASYRSLQESLATNQTAFWTPYGYRSQVGVTLGWNAGGVGAFSAGLTQENYFAGDPGHVATLSWNKSWPGGVSVNIGLAHRTARVSVLDASGFQPGNVRVAGSNYAYASVMVPFGSGITSRTFAQRTDGLDRVGTNLQHQVNEFFGYQATIENVTGPTASGSGSSFSAYGTPYYTTLGAGVSKVRNYNSQYAEASGSMLATADGVAFSPYQTQDSFGTLRTSGVVGARIETSQGPIWSGPGGIAAVSSLSPYQDSRMELGGNSIPLNIEVSNGLQIIQVSRGAVPKLKMDMHIVKRTLLVVTLPDGEALPAGAIILRGNRDYFTAAGEGGRVLITDAGDGDTFSAEMANGNRCTIRDIAPVKTARNQLLDTATAICK